MKLLQLAALILAFSAPFLFGNNVPAMLLEAEVPAVPTSQKAPAPKPPWFTGPLLTPSGHVVPRGYVNFEPYVYGNVNTGVYDNDWNSSSIPDFINVQWQAPVFIGITPIMDIIVVPQASWNSTEGVSNLVFNDFILEWDLQLLQDTQNNKLPGIKLYVQEAFPTGRFERLEARKFGTDIGGNGTFATNVGIVITRLFHIYDDHFLSLRFNPFYIFRTKVNVEGINVYGGASDTNARVKPGASYGAYFGAEYNLTRNWALALDVFGFYKFENTFTGNPGTLPTGLPASLAAPESLQFSLAPAIEYNFSASVGIIGGAWFTIAGKNTPRFASGVIAINYFGPLPTSTKYQYIQTGGF